MHMHVHLFLVFGFLAVERLVIELTFCFNMCTPRPPTSHSFLLLSSQCIAYVHFKAYTRCFAVNSEECLHHE
ncbi:hypothetical protein BC835DRAFT_1358288 [Cytidiella melzeri]|nr:hypothetical protein BC835DRAFT_1358288 [Cytidiella melzeri]